MAKMKVIEISINFIYRMVFGIICTYFLNQFVQLIGGSLQVGLNAWTAMVLGGLGMPGVVLLFMLQVVSGL